MPAGRIIFLNGCSSAGKTSLALKLQDILDEPYQHLALDQFRDGMPSAYRGLNSPAGMKGARGLNVVPITATAQPYTAIRFGDVGKRLLKGMRRAIAAMAAAGNNIIIDDIILEPEYLADYLQCLMPFDVTFVGVRCPLSVIEQREASRPGRFPGTARGHYNQVHRHELYDVEVDTAANTPEECARKVIDSIQTPGQRAFELLRTRATPASFNP